MPFPVRARTAPPLATISVESVSVDHNDLRTLREEVFVPLTNLKSITLHANPWVCDCNLKNFRLEAIIALLFL